MTEITLHCVRTLRPCPHSRLITRDWSCSGVTSVTLPLAPEPRYCWIARRNSGIDAFLRAPLSQPLPGDSVKRQALSVLIFFLVVAAASFGQSQPVSSTQLMAWLAAGVPSTRLVRIVQERGVAGAPSKEQIHQFELAGANATLLRALADLKLANLKLANLKTFQRQPHCPEFSLRVSRVSASSGHRCASSALSPG